MKKLKPDVQEESDTFQSKWKVCPSLTRTHTALICTHKYTTGRQVKFEALFLSLRRKPLKAYITEGETGLQHPFLFATGQTKTNSIHRQSRQLPKAGQQQCLWCTFASSWIAKRLDVAFSNWKLQECREKDTASRPSSTCKITGCRPLLPLPSL